MKKVCKHVIADGNAMNIEFGFVPDKVIAFTKAEETNQVVYLWWKEVANNGTANGQYGFARATTGEYTKCASAAYGFSTLDSSTIVAMLPAPDGEGERAAAIYGSFAEAKAASVTPTARTTSVVGTVIRPTVQNGCLYECVTQGGAMTSLTEPTWGTTLGGTTSDGSNTWICRSEKTKVAGAKGITIGASISTDTDEWIIEAELWDRVFPEVDAGDYGSSEYI
jgi:hypothetical protein